MGRNTPFNNPYNSLPIIIVYHYKSIMYFSCVTEKSLHVTRAILGGVILRSTLRVSGCPPQMSLIRDSGFALTRYLLLLKEYHSSFLTQSSLLTCRPLPVSYISSYIVSCSSNVKRKSLDYMVMQIIGHSSLVSFFLESKKASISCSSSSSSSLGSSTTTGLCLLGARAAASCYFNSSTCCFNSATYLISNSFS